MNLTEETQPTLVRKSSIFSSLLILVGFVLAGLFVGQFFAFMGLLPMFDYSIEAIQGALTNPLSSPKAKSALLILQAASTIFGFILAPLLHQKLIDRRHTTSLISYFGKRHSPTDSTEQQQVSRAAAPQQISVVALGLVFLLMIAFMFANSIVIEWNMNLDFSQLSPSFEEWARGKEEELKELTEYLTRFSNVGGLLVGLIVIAVLPAIGEELLFRGIVQPNLQKLLGNPHAAIWIAAFLFSAIHLQFYGFFPRLLLGALFGYLFYWSGNLWYAIFGHFVNNGFTLAMLYLYQQDITNIDMEATESVAWPIATFAFVVGTLLLYQFWQMTKIKQRYG